MPTYDAEFTRAMLPGSHKDTNRWQGVVRAGALDLNLFCYAVECCKETPIDGICLTWFDQIIKNNRIWPICATYKSPAMINECYVEYLKNKAEPEIENHLVKDNLSNAELFGFVANVLQQYTDLPLMMLSTGPTELDKISSKNIRRI